MATVVEAPAATWETAEDLLNDLGGVAPSRVRIKPPPGSATEADLIAANAEGRGLFELVEGVLVEKAMGYAGSVLGGVILAVLRASSSPATSGSSPAPTG